ncbi:hypothetical protein B0H17DRAFT_1220703 [Mycena rosella]|uniref:Uncharacterized protein n=1 Tax=Mycena rosella TaxID=1033263 RepID=A0AAD7B899_MYCRO|nr:hypothetical protein B0H17DRAFT_1220703 [Mycena rosella]
MPKLCKYLLPLQRLVWDADNKEAEATQLFMPSDLGSHPAREKAYAKDLDSVKARLQVSKAEEALVDLRQALRTRLEMLGQINLKVQRAKLRYHYAWQALLKLNGHGEWEKKLKVLTDDGVCAMNECSLTDEEVADRERLRDVGTLSWIWCSVSDKEELDDKIHEALRVEWCKAYSWVNHWHEHLVIVEEMRRTIEFGHCFERRWIAMASACTIILGEPSVPITLKVLEGASANALEQADWEHRTSAQLVEAWAPIRQGWRCI